jgi:hypothetical protein
VRRTDADSHGDGVLRGPRVLLHLGEIGVRGEGGGGEGGRKSEFETGLGA